MVDIVPNVTVSMPSQLFTLSRSFKAAFNGNIYIGQIGTDPTVPTNQIQVYLENEDGTHIPVAQPIKINAGGYPVYGGQIAKFVTVQGHSMAVYDSYNVQQFYFPNVLKYDPDQLRQQLAAPGGVNLVNGALSEERLAQSDGAAMIGTSNGNTVQQELERINDSITELTPTDRRMDFSSADNPDRPYGAFCDGVSLGRYEYLIHRESKTHFDDAGGVSQLRIMVVDTLDGDVTSLALIPPVPGNDFRDPSIAWFSELRRLVVTCQLFNVATGTYDRMAVYYFDTSGALYSTTYNGVGNYFQWGKALLTPQNETMIVGYSTDNSNPRIGVFVGNSLAQSETGFNFVSDVFTGEPSLLRNECAAIVWNNRLVIAARTQANDGVTNPLQNMSVIFTNDLSGKTGWSAVTRIPVALVAPRMFIAPNGDLVITGGSVRGGVRGSVAAISTNNLVNWGVPNTVYSDTTGVGGYSSAYLRDDGSVGIYTYNEIDGYNAANTWLSYVPVTTFLYGLIPTKSQVHMYGGYLAYGIAPVYNEFTDVGGYIYINIPKALAIKGVGFWLSDAATTGAVVIETGSGTLISSFGTTPIATTPTLVSVVRAAGVINLAAGLYRVKTTVGRIGYIKSASSLDISRKGLIATTVGVGTAQSNIENDCAIGLLI